MFGIDDILIGSLLGGGLSALNGKDPLKGAAMGGLGGAVLPGLLGTSAAGGAAPGLAGNAGQGFTAGAGQSMGLAAPSGGMGLSVGGGQLGMTAPAGALTGAPAPGLLSGMSGAMEGIKPVMQAAGTAAQVSQAMSPKPQQIMPSPTMTPMPNNNLGNIVAQSQNDQALRQQIEEQRRAQRRGMWGG